MLYSKKCIVTAGLLRAITLKNLLKMELNSRLKTV